MGCCVCRQDKGVIESSNIPLLYQEPLEYEKRNNCQNDSNIVPNTVILKHKTKSNKNSNHKTQKGYNKTDKKNKKSMSVLKELSYNEVHESTKYFQNNKFTIEELVYIDIFVNIFVNSDG